MDGQRLADLIEVGDFIPPFGWLPPAQQARFARLLLGRDPSDLPSGRLPLFVCPECVDYACGVFTCRFQKGGGVVEWSAPGMEGQWTGPQVFRFDSRNYYQVFAGFLAS